MFYDFLNQKSQCKWISENSKMQMTEICTFLSTWGIFSVIHFFHVIHNSGTTALFYSLSLWSVTYQLQKEEENINQDALINSTPK